MNPRNSEAFLDVATDFLNRGHRVRFRAEGHSMHPTIRHGEAIVVEPAVAADLRCGDVAFYHAQRGVTAHRVVRAERERFLTRGDASLSADEVVGRHQILGRVVSVERKSRPVDLTSRRAKMRHSIGAWTMRVKEGSRGLALLASNWQGEKK